MSVRSVSGCPLAWPRCPTAGAVGRTGADLCRLTSSRPARLGGGIRKPLCDISRKGCGHPRRVLGACSVVGWLTSSPTNTRPGPGQHQVQPAGLLEAADGPARARFGRVCSWCQAGRWPPARTRCAHALRPGRAAAQGLPVLLLALAWSGSVLLAGVATVPAAGVVGGTAPGRWLTGCGRCAAHTGPGQVEMGGGIGGRGVPIG